LCIRCKDRIGGTEQPFGIFAVALCRKVFRNNADSPDSIGKRSLNPS
jgi:hypothetical protein